MTESRRPTCFIHIGPPKTGSSSIKHFVWNNEPRLDKLGLYFPKLEGPNGKRARNHEQLATSDEIKKSGELRPNAQLWPEIEKVAQARQKNILLSSEMFCKNLADPDTLDRVCAFFDRFGYRVLILAYVRDQPSWLNSWYVQSQKRMARLATFAEYADSAMELGRVEPARYLAPYFDHPGCDVEVVSFEQAAKTNLVEDFIRRCGIKPTRWFDRSPLRNSNAGAKTVYAAQEIMRRLEASEGLKDIPGYAPIYNAFKRRARRADWDETPYVALDQEEYERIRAQYAQSNETFAQEHFGVSWTELCPPRTVERSMFDPETASMREVKEVQTVVDEVVAQFEALKAREQAEVASKAAAPVTDGPDDGPTMMPAAMEVDAPAGPRVPENVSRPASRAATTNPGTPARTCFIHIGPYKTGSSSIKHFFRANEDEIARQGLYLPKLVGENGKRARNHGELIKLIDVTRSGDLRPGVRLWPEIDAVAREGAMNILLSSEMFSDSLVERPDNFEMALSFFEARGYRVVILAYVRDQPAWLNSWYVQSQKRLAGLKTFDEFVDAAVNLGRVEPARYLRPYFENERCDVEVIPFEQVAKTGLEVDFLRRCGVLDASKLQPSTVRNTNAGAKTVYVAQEVMRRTGGAKNLRLVPGYPEQYRHFENKCRQRGWDETPYVALDQEIYDGIRARFAASNEAFAKAYLGASWADLFPAKSPTRSVFDPARAKAEEVAELDKMIANVSRKFAKLLKTHGGARRNRQERNEALVA